VAEAARLLGMSRASIYNRRAEGQISFVKVGARTYVTADELDRFVAAAEPAEMTRPA
jgi:excisionase family DNA binding protein